jgi:hypothetical protein
MTTEQVQATTWKDQARVAFKYAFGDEHWWAAEQLINNESGWNPWVINQSSGACGLFQSLPCSKVLSVAGTLDNIEGQIQWGIGYIRDRYDNPTNALAFWKCIGLCGGIWKANNWY